MKVYLITKNDFEGVACAILSKYIFGDHLEIEFLNKFTSYQILNNKVSNKENTLILISGFKFKSYGNVIVTSNFNELYNSLNKMFYEEFDNTKLHLFHKHVNAYLDWSWKEKELYLAKNIDELTKIFNKKDIINNIAERIHNKELLITETEKTLIKAEKNKITSIIESKKVNIQRKDNLNIFYTYSEIYKTEMANILINKEINNIKPDIVYIIDMCLGVVSVKYASNSKTRYICNKLEKIGATMGKNNTATIKFANMFDKIIINSFTKDL